MTHKPSFLVAVDVGSTSARAGVFDAKGVRLARAEHPFAIGKPLPDHAEHSSDEIWQSVCTAVRSALKESDVRAEQVAGLAFDATCSLAMFDGAGNPVTVSSTGRDAWNVVMWADHRAVAEAEEISATRHHALDYVGGVMSPEMQLPKLLWLKRNLPQAWARYGLALDLADFLTWRATDRIAVSACTITCKWTYLNHETPGWQQDLLDRIGLADLPARAGLPERATPIGSAAGPLSPRAAEELGLSPNCIVGVGLIDAHAGGVGLLAALEPPQLNQRIAMIAGTSSCHMAASSEPRRIPGVWGPYYGAMLPGLWLTEAGQSATGALLDHILRWHAEGRALGAEGHKRVIARVQDLLATEGPGFAEDLLVLPDFHGNRSPLADPNARGMIYGLTLDSSFDSLAKLYYAAAVGIAFGTRQIFDALNAKGYDVRYLHLTGGHIANPWLVQLYADVTGCRVILPGEPDSVLLGTAIVAATASNIHASLAASAHAMIRPGMEIAANPQSVMFFEKQYRRFLAMQKMHAELRR